VKNTVAQIDLTTLSMYLSADGPQTSGLVTHPFQAVGEDVFIC